MLLTKIKKYLHIHRFNKPLVSMYVSFNIRNIIYQCKCGKKISKKVFIPYASPFPIETTLWLSKKDFNEILNYPNFIKEVLHSGGEFRIIE